MYDMEKDPHTFLEKNTISRFSAGPFSSETFVDHGFPLRVGDCGITRDCEYGASGVQGGPRSQSL